MNNNTTTQSNAETLADKAKALCAEIHESSLDDSVKATLTATALQASFRFADAESDLRQIADYQASAAKAIANGQKATHQLDSLVTLSMRAADSMREAELQFEHVLGMWDATYNLRH